MTFLISFLLTRPNAPGQQMIKTSVFIEVLTFAGGQLINYFLNSYESSKGGHFPFLHDSIYLSDCLRVRKLHKFEGQL